MALDAKPDIILLSAYLMHYEVVREIARLAKERAIPVLVGGPMFNIEATAEHWRHLPGVTALVGAEADLIIPQLVDTAVKGGDLLQFAGVTLADGRTSLCCCRAFAPFERHTLCRFQRLPLGEVSCAHRADHDGARLSVGEMRFLF